MRFHRTFEILNQRAAEAPQADCLVAKTGGKWLPLSNQQVQEAANACSLGLRHLGVERGDKVAIISNNRPEWVQADFGISQLGAVSVPMYPTITVEDYRYIFQDAAVKVVLVSDRKLHARVKEALKDLDQAPEHVFTFDQVAGAHHFDELLALGKQANAAELEPLKAAVQPDDLLTLIYTSGTTGRPKGVMLSHGNILSNCHSLREFIPVVPGEKALSFLPLSHIFERTATFLYLKLGLAVYYAEGLEVIADNLREVQPQVFTTVPRLLEKIYDKIVAKGQTLEGIKKKLFFWSLDLGLRYDPQRSLGPVYNAQLALANKLVFSKWREALGSKVKCIISGGGALQPRLARVFWAAGIHVMEGYGLTETSPVIAACRYNREDNMPGTVGPVIPDVEVKIAPDGEILTKSASVMKGYYNRPDLTAEVIDQEGWFHTGDIGEFVNGRFLKITGRKKEMFKTSGGKYVAPQVIENKLKESPLIEQAMVVGDGQKYAAALLVPAFEELRNWAKQQQISFANDAALVAHERVQKLYRELVSQYNAAFAQWEQVKKVAVLHNPWTVETGELTPTMKLKRKIISANNEQRIAGLFQ
ncbi:AMP-dependent synthetase/ligase [Solirubrum puertoriconensis]|uniref:AMP-dependent synthetase n=1 Tax=Solirubrum puertoriconensis TaxID=1751427 RepID=A0A9X0L5J5_SOLP1|nr:long-chain fatty acid--CoA ligase [Solirubrum puertoriconensis]KUG08655.1 AMP-dependent synthetase [Solirubrum puertoriconensis]